MKLLTEVGEATQGALEELGGLTELLGESLRVISAGRMRLAETATQAYVLGVESFSIVALTSLFTGLVFSLESAEQAVQYGVGTLVGGAVTFTIARELGPMLTAVVVAGRAGAAIAAELGSMVVTEQIEALESLGLSPVRILVVPRLVALVLLVPLLTILGDVISIGAGMWLANSVAHISTSSFLQSARSTIHTSDFLLGMVKSAVFGMVIALVGCYQGLRTRGGAAGVGAATTRAVVVSIITIFISNFILSYVLFGYHK